jgi:phosphohistidine swiveling domain-containing protein
MAAPRVSIILPLEKITPADRPLAGGKACSLARLAAAGFEVPDTLCITAEAYRRYLRSSGLPGRIALELARKPLEQMRWEEVYDSSLRIRHSFTLTPMPGALADELSAALTARFGGRGVAVRSSALAEDSALHSFAGLHESYLNVSGAAAILETVIKVWASLWSESALLYRRELGLEPEQSAMGVIVQVFVPGEVSGVAFGRNPLNEAEMVIEAVPGLNQGLVDGQVEPDRWIMDRDSGEVSFSGAADRDADLRSLTSERRGPLLDAVRLVRITRLLERCEELFSVPQDVEWTLAEDRLVVLQSRPITTRAVREGSVSSPWQQSSADLQILKQRVENELLPAMAAEAARMDAVDPARLDDKALSVEIAERTRVLEHWRRVYSEELIPLAHGVRLFGKVYNQRLKPADPFDFLDLLRPDELESLKRNRLLEKLAELVHSRPELRAAAERGELAGVSDILFKKLYSQLLRQAGDLPVADGQAGENLLAPLLLELASSPANRRTARKGQKTRAEEYLAAFPQPERGAAAALLDLARASYRLRDDDNIFLGRIERQLRLAEAEGRRRLTGRRRSDPGTARLRRSLERIPSSPVREQGGRPAVRSRQLVGQPAGLGLATARARVILQRRELFSFRRGEILVCDALDPNMTFVIPLAAGIVERRGGMLIHGAIIAREYGLPCVTGIHEATRRITSGARLTVDGYLGIVVVHDDPEIEG